MVERKVLMQLDQKRQGEQIMSLLNLAFQVVGATGTTENYETKWFASVRVAERIFRYPGNMEPYKKSFFAELGFRNLNPSKWGRLLGIDYNKFNPSDIIVETTLLAFGMVDKFEMNLEIPNPSRYSYPEDLFEGNGCPEENLITGAISAFFSQIIAINKNG